MTDDRLDTEGPRGRTAAAAGRTTDRTLFGSTPRARWAFGLSLLVVLVFSEAWLKPFNGDGTEPVDNGLIRSLYYPGYLAGLGLIALSPWRVVSAVARTPLLWGLVGYAFVSTLWSIDPSTTERRAVALMLCTLCGLAVGAQLSWRGLTRALALSFTLLSAGSFLAALLLPKFGRMQTDFPGAWSGLFIEKNGLGAIAAETIVFCAAAFLVDRPRRWLWAAAAALGAAVLALSTSKTSLVVALIGCLCFAFAWGVRQGRVAAVIATFFGVVGVGALGFAVAFAPQTLLGLLGKDATLTGRTRIWAAVMRQIAMRPRTGFGYGAVWTDHTGWGPVYWVVKQYGARPTYAHNGWVDLWLGLGIYAVWIWAALLAITWISTLIATYRRADAYLALPFIAMFTLNNLTESSILFYNSITWVLFAIVAAKLLTPDPVAAARTLRPRGTAAAAGVLPLAVAG